MQKPSKLISVLPQVEICNVNKYEMCIFAWGQSHNIVDIGAGAALIAAPAVCAWL